MGLLLELLLELLLGLLLGLLLELLLELLLGWLLGLLLELLLELLLGWLLGRRRSSCVAGRRCGAVCGGGVFANQQQEARRSSCAAGRWRSVATFLPISKKREEVVALRGGLWREARRSSRAAGRSVARVAYLYSL